MAAKQIATTIFEPRHAGSYAMPHRLCQGCQHSILALAGVRAKALRGPGASGPALRPPPRPLVPPPPNSGLPAASSRVSDLVTELPQQVGGQMWLSPTADVIVTTAARPPGLG